MRYITLALVVFTMNIIRFYNRHKFFEEYHASKPTARCVVCATYYYPEFTKYQNTLLLLNCEHLIHRGCLQMSRSKA